MSSSTNALNRSTAFLCAAALMLAACSENATTPTPRGIAGGASSQDVSPEMNSPNGHGIVFPTRDWFAHNAKPGGSSSTGIYYHGGPVLLSQTNVVAIYWASSAIYNNGPTPPSTGTGSQDASLVGYFLNHLGGSSYFNINTSYTDGGGNHIANVVNYTSYWANNTNAPAGTQNVSDADMLNMLSDGFMNNKIAYDPNTLYAIFTAGAVNLGGGFGTQYCAYHYWGTVNTPQGAQTVQYAAMPYDYAYPGSCTMSGTYNAPNGDPGADYEVNTLAHETEETTTDPRGTAWYDRRGYENADKCAWTFGTVNTTSSGGNWNITVGSKNFLVQRNWVNANSGGCALSY
ncbi:MAG TPA: hypothetical protein VLN49_21035 [Gemmatimonadaceae bacterium]|nr:hypothetical protein [Gemmatimonadaceae bacterium]